MLLQIIAALEGLNRMVGRGVCYLAMLMVLLQFCIVLFRHVFGISYIFFDEGVLYMHATLIMLGAGYTFLIDGHVRVDILYNSLDKEKQRIVNVIGNIVFLLPTMITLLWFTWPSVHNSWRVWEGAISVGGIPASFLLKTLIPLFCALLIIQGITFLLQSLVHTHNPTCSNTLTD